MVTRIILIIHYIMIYPLDHELLREGIPYSAHKLSNNMYIVLKVVYIGMFPNIDMPTDIGPCLDDDMYVTSLYI